MNLTALFEAVKDCDLADVLARAGYNVRGDRKVVPNPLRSDDDTPSFSVGPAGSNRWKDFGTGNGGDLIDFLEATGLSVDDARREAARLLNVSEGPRISPGAGSLNPHTAKFEVVVQSTNDFTELVNQAHEALANGTSATAHRARAYLKHRGLDIEGEASDVLRNAKVGVVDETVHLPDHLSAGTYRGRLLFPYLEDDGRTLFFNARAAGDVPNAEKFRKPAGATQTRPFLQHSMPNDADHVILVEAELDALSLSTALGVRAPVLAAGGGKVEARHLEPFADRLHDVFLLYDADEAGERFTEAAQKALKSLGVNVQPLALPGNSKDVNDALREHGAGVLAQHINAQIAATQRTSDAAYISTTYLEELARRHSRPDATYTTGLQPVDTLLGGGFMEGLHVLGGITGGGKTSFALHVAFQNAMAGRPVLYASFEQSKHELWSRIASRLTRIPRRALKRGTYDDVDGEYAVHELLQHHDAYKTLQQVSDHLVVLEAGDALSRRSGEATVDDLHRIASRMKHRSGIPPLIVVDYLQRVPGPEDTRGRDIRERVGAVAGFLQVALARDLEAPVLALSSVGRESYGANPAKVSVEEMLRSLKESGEIEYTAYTVSLLYGFEQGAEPSNLTPGPIDTWKPIAFHLAKNRDGDTGQKFLKWTAGVDEWSAHEVRKVNW